MKQITSRNHPDGFLPLPLKEYTMPKEFFDKWIQALESGEYIQGNGKLISSNPSGPNRYCCLGVACAISGFESTHFNDAGYIQNHNGGGGGVSKELYESDQLPDLVKGDWRSTLDANTFPGQVAQMNDANVPFTEIALWIKTYVKPI
jgi:hypothetical protein